MILEYCQEGSIKIFLDGYASGAQGPMKQVNSFQLLCISKMGT